MKRLVGILSAAAITAVCSTAFAQAPAAPETNAAMARDAQNPGGAPTGPRTHYMRAIVTKAAGLPQISAFKQQDSALLGILTQSNALLIRPIDDGARDRGEEVGYLPI